VKIYLAAPFSWKDQMNIYASELRELGMEVTSRWLEEPHASTTQLSELEEEQHSFYAKQDCQDISNADVLVFFSDPSKTIVRGGRHVEFGIALALGMPVVVIGEKENIFHYSAGITHCENWTQAKNILTAFSVSA
jgi:nucleoside 2-deoxyribosyltransferase